MWLGREWESLPCFPIPQHPHTHAHTHTFLPPAHHHQHWHPAHDAAHLICQPSHFRCRGNISQDGSFWARLYSNDLAGSLSSSWHSWRIPRWQYRWHQGLLVKKGWEGGGRQEADEEEVAILHRLFFLKNCSVLSGPRLFTVFNRRSATRS